MALPSTTMISVGAVPYGYQAPPALPVQGGQTFLVQSGQVMHAQPIQPQCQGACPAVSYQQTPQQPVPVAIPGAAPPQSVHGFYPYYGLGAEEATAKKKKRAWYDCFGLFSKDDE